MSFIQNLFRKKTEESMQRRAEMSRKIEDLNHKADELAQELATVLEEIKPAKKKKKAR